MIDIAMLAELRRLNDLGATGMVFAVSEDNRHCRIGLAAGNIVAVSFRALRGKEALLAFRETRCRSYQFVPGEVNERHVDLPQTAQILGGTTEAPAPGGLPPEQLARVERELLDLVGPMASVLIEEAAGATSLDGLLARLAPSLDAADARTLARRLGLG
ncbi:hypothetical protein [Derxia lacustris]|uniref:hypothetical protein n=1 Tax=Derxia lacustris TaxID=764842 RepID=UPI000A1785D8|nr:hypothetical protein [Derxia lacustris]